MLLAVGNLRPGATNASNQPDSDYRSHRCSVVGSEHLHPDGSEDQEHSEHRGDHLCGVVVVERVRDSGRTGDGRGSQSEMRDGRTHKVL